MCVVCGGVRVCVVCVRARARVLICKYYLDGVVTVINQARAVGGKVSVRVCV